ncbi:MAG: diphthine synthase [Candidatus Aenigmarchaeota archaeon]|nr:diphthine synthase [Candidatus Aenigmarchaeota archaeon]
MTLTLIGLGLHSEKDLSLKAVEEARNSDNVYIELYTGKWFGNLDNLEKIVGKKIVELKRSDLEENSGKIIEESKKQKISILIQGDPLVATTHSSLISEARKLGIKTKVIHNASIVSAIGETGLHMYKFGQMVTIPFPEKTKGKPPESIFEIIEENKKRELHTLCLLDVAAEENRYMDVGIALKILLDRNIVKETDKIIVFAKAGSDNSLVIYDDVVNLMRNRTETPAVIIVPGKLHFTEEEYLITLNTENRDS